jgi:hypothetical protein
MRSYQVSPLCCNTTRCDREVFTCIQAFASWNNQRELCIGAENRRRSNISKNCNRILSNLSEWISLPGNFSSASIESYEFCGNTRRLRSYCHRVKYIWLIAIGRVMCKLRNSKRRDRIRQKIYLLSQCCPWVNLDCFSRECTTAYNFKYRSNSFIP